MLCEYCINCFYNLKTKCTVKIKTSNLKINLYDYDSDYKLEYIAVYGRASMGS